MVAGVWLTRALRARCVPCCFEDGGTRRRDVVVDGLAGGGGDMVRRVRAEDVLHGYCWGLFDRDTMGCKVVVEVSDDGARVVAKGMIGWAAREEFVADGPDVAARLCKYLEPQEGVAACAHTRVAL